MSDQLPAIERPVLLRNPSPEDRAASQTLRSVTLSFIHRLTDWVVRLRATCMERTAILANVRDYKTYCEAVERGEMKRYRRLVRAESELITDRCIQQATSLPTELSTRVDLKRLWDNPSLLDAIRRFEDTYTSLCEWTARVGVLTSDENVRTWVRLLVQPTKR